ncbi:hypothetical protein OG866_04845 [Streptomyces sp. NBC_00663]|uniref:hypothetical protein n=1 Tax=Streptomyces sp. NBC_00663 TaxID=2975801 RepID=UPI002E34A361|nr:hypothetical protein [Streptomyces sp. NBC_00663]
MEHSRQHMYELIDHLVGAGNAVRYHPSSAVDPFWHQQGGPECFLERPIDFGAARTAPGQPEDLVFDEGEDRILCLRCWTVITGSDHRFPPFPGHPA